MLKYKQGPMMLNYVAQDHEIVRGRPCEIDLSEAPAATGWFFLSPAGEHFSIPAEQVTVDQEGVRISLTKWDTLALPSDVPMQLFAGNRSIDTYTPVSLAGLELRYWELADAMPNWTQPEFKAFSYALHMAIFRIFGHTDQFFVWAFIDGLQEDVLDEMAIELRAPYYLEAMPIETKREIVKKALLWHEKAGTLAAVEDLIHTAYGRGEIVEWPDFDGDPYTFRFRTPEDNRDPDFFRHFNELIRRVKNVRSHLVGIDFIREENTDLYFGDAVAEINQTVLDDDGIPDPVSEVGLDVYMGAAVAEVNWTVLADGGIPDPVRVISNEIYTGTATEQVIKTVVA